MATSTDAPASSSFNSGGSSREIVNSEIYTDGNNQIIKALNILPIIATATVGPYLSFTAAGVEAKISYADPAASPVYGNCYDNGGNNVSNYYPGTTTYYTGNLGWSQKSVYTCDAQTMGYGSVNGYILNGVYYEKTEPGAAFVAAKQGSACGNSARALHESSCSDSPYRYRDTSVSYNYYQKTDSTFFNGSNYSPAFDCSGGLTIEFSDISFHSNGVEKVVFSGVSHWYGPTKNCGENLFKTVIRTFN